ncbi:UTP18, U3 small nucleolar RNA-associated protein 18 [Babesia microti strain RI]|uniref:UTP18, U3 small nucleolar RNA-associated protein 18 n=1 Tax=Babesia microti (strain RI) TaxID=1133968 RepID=I7JDI3_BABMR|nr:UTP18, U3 small nucleolar RNA-associated protein 18 [Babesia microti strain RI]CCF75820.2 UTP18, U3 small nucleolar RNA-associated protein 18 [Babesia microti strain RI]|eukprot:XP_021337203.1 UTP18, U3 small nucleolar RNA-associated protein 18 [Babesia microti strain RI]
MPSVEKIHELLNLDKLEPQNGKSSTKREEDTLNLKVTTQRKLKWVKVAKETSDFTQASDVSLNVRSLAKGTKLRIKEKSTIKVSSKPVKQLKFHQSGNIILSLSTNLSLVNVNSKSQQCISIDKFSAIDTCFTCSGDALYILGRRSLVIHDLHGTYRQISGFGTHKLLKITANMGDKNLYSIVTDDRLAMLYDTRAGNTISKFRMKSDCKGIGFAPRSSNLISIDTDGCLYKWDYVANKMEEMVTIDELYKPTTLAISDTAVSAVGTESGYLGLIDICTPGLKLIKCFGNLTTEITSTAITGNGRVVAVYCSPHKSNGIRMVDVNSQKIHLEWPNQKSTLGRVYSVALGKYLALGNKNGLVKVYSVK